ESETETDSAAIETESEESETSESASPRRNEEHQIPATLPSERSASNADSDLDIPDFLKKYAALEVRHPGQPHRARGLHGPARWVLERGLRPVQPRPARRGRWRPRRRQACRTRARPRPNRGAAGLRRPGPQHLRADRQRRRRTA